MSKYSIAIVKLSSYGDIAQALRALSECDIDKARYNITWLVDIRCKGVLAKCDIIDDVIHVDYKKMLFEPFSKKACEQRKALREKQFDVVIDLQGNCKSAFVRFFLRSKVKVGMDFSSSIEWPSSLFLTKKVRIAPMHIVDKNKVLLSTQFVLKERLTPQKIYSLENTKRNSDYLVFAIGSAWESKKLSTHSIIMVITAIQKREKLPVIFVCKGKKEEEEAALIQKALPFESKVESQLSVSQLYSLFYYAKAIIAFDSFCLHLAGLTNQPLFGIFGPTNPSYIMPKGAFNASVWLKCPLQSTFTHICPQLKQCVAPCTKNANEDFIIKRLSSWLTHL